MDDEDSDVVSDADEENDEDVRHEAVYDVKISENDKNVLSCRLSFSTSEERKTFVKYYSEKHAGYKITEDSAKSDHYFFLWGMREDLDYKVEIYSDEETPELLAETTFRSGQVPDFIRKPRLVANEKEYVQPGFVLFAQVIENAAIQEPVIMMADSDGFVVWYFRYDDFPGEAYLEDPDYREKTKSIFTGVHKMPIMEDIFAEEGIEIDLEGNILWKSPEIASAAYTDTGWHHEYKLLDDDTILYVQADRRNMLLTDKLINVDRDYNLLWTWSYIDDSGLEQPECSDSSTDWCDWTHTNSAMLFRDERTVFVNSAREGFFRIDMDSKDVVWKFGRNGSFTMLSDTEHPWPEFQHDPKFYDSSRKRVLFYDNGFIERFYSRIIEYEIDEETLTAEITFEFDGSGSGREWLSPGWGDADYLENGNIFVTQGLAAAEKNCAFWEITRDGRVVWELYMWMSDDSSEKVEVYNVDKFMPDLEFLK